MSNNTVTPDFDGIYGNNGLSIIEKRQQGYISQAIVIMSIIEYGRVRTDAEPLVLTMPYNVLSVIEQYAAPLMHAAQKQPNCHTWRAVIAVINPDSTRKIIAEYPGDKGAGYNEKAAIESKSTLN